ncbi:MAG: DUF4040 domain-containing protein [Anaerolineaceae bacterium]|nr:DUF4040 domain-containing protein [Anaerolineaceae bacterium]
MAEILIVAGILVCSVMAFKANRLLVSALWLAGSSALVALMIYLLGAPEVAVIELSVGAGLVTILFVFAINIAGEEAVSVKALLPKPLAWGLVVLAVALLGWLCLPGLAGVLPALGVRTFTEVMWGDRSLDAMLQVVLIFAGVLGVLGLLAEGKPASSAGGHS